MRRSGSCATYSATESSSTHSPDSFALPPKTTTRSALDPPLAS